MNLSSLIIIIVLGVVLLVLISLMGRAKPRCIDSLHYQNEWLDIVVLQDDYKSRSMAVVKADKLLDNALKGLAFSGNTMAERLVAAKNQLKSRDAVWSAHKLRNKIVHDVLFEPSEIDIKRAMTGYRKAFRELGVF